MTQHLRANQTLESESENLLGVGPNDLNLSSKNQTLGEGRSPMRTRIAVLKGVTSPTSMRASTLVTMVMAATTSCVHYTQPP